MLLVYASFLFFQLKTHAHLFEDEEEGDGGDEEEAKSVPDRELAARSASGSSNRGLTVAARSVEHYGQQADDSEHGHIADGDHNPLAVTSPAKAAPGPSARHGESSRVPPPESGRPPAPGSVRPAGPPGTIASARKGVLKPSVPPAPVLLGPEESVSSVVTGRASPSATGGADADVGNILGSGTTARRSARPMGTASAAVDAVVATGASASLAPPPHVVATAVCPGRSVCIDAVLTFPLRCMQRTARGSVAMNSAVSVLARRLFPNAFAKPPPLLSKYLSMANEAHVGRWRNCGEPVHSFTLSEHMPALNLRRTLHPRSAAPATGPLLPSAPSRRRRTPPCVPLGVSDCLGGCSICAPSLRSP